MEKGLWRSTGGAEEGQSRGRGGFDLGEEGRQVQRAGTEPPICAHR